MHQLPDRSHRPEPSLIRKKGILVHHGGARVAVDIVEFIRAEREARSRHLVSAVV